MKTMLKTLKASFAINKSTKELRCSRTTSRSSKEDSLSGTCILLEDESAEQYLHEPSSLMMEGHGLSDTPTWFENAIFHEQLSLVRNDPDIPTLTLKDFIQRANKEDLAALTDLLQRGNRAWKEIKFQDTVTGSGYRRWQFKKNNLKHCLGQVSFRQKVPPTMIFEETMEINLDTMGMTSIVSLLSGLPKNRHVKSLTLKGVLGYRDIPEFINVLGKVLQQPEEGRGCLLKSLSLCCAFDGEIKDYEKWDRKITLGGSRLQGVGAKRGVDMTIQTCRKAIDC